MKRKKHGANHLSNYLDIHRKVLAVYQEGQETPRFYEEKFITQEYLQLTVDNVKIQTKRGNWIKIKIHKDIEVERIGKKPVAKVHGYTYHARYADEKMGGNILRYCSEHQHRPYHHKHIYKKDGKDFETIEIANDEFPHVNEFFDELIENY
ncbi:MAG: hypothetical protein JNM93_13050 [Bacteriovoracaceae bacterium]|nr:hypothetical protein [Bacteriovoracaceae bacterium]